MDWSICFPTFHFLISLSNEILFFGHENCTRPIRRIKSIDLFASLSLLSNEIPNSYDTTIFSNGVWSLFFYFLRYLLWSSTRALFYVPNWSIKSQFLQQTLGEFVPTVLLLVLCWQEKKQCICTDKSSSSSATTTLQNQLNKSEIPYRKR